jgi:hypothetical protein
MAGLRAKALTFAVLVAAARPLAAQEKPATGARIEVLVLGTYHMANPGRDIFNTQADDVLAPKRQDEIARVVAALRAFAPTKIAVEQDVGDQRMARAYADYLEGKHELTRNEVEQIAFRLAKELGHKTVYGVDADGEFPYPRLVDYAKAHGRSQELDALMSEVGDAVKAQSAYLASHTVLETLLYMNADDKVAQDVGFYFRQAHFGEPWNWAGADLIADWYRRNLRIYSNVINVAQSPGDRVLVIFGAGHLGWLRQIFGADPTVKVRQLAEFAK